MSSDAVSTYVRPRRGLIAASSDTVVSTSAAVPQRRPISSTSAPQRRPEFQDLISEVAQALAMLPSFGFSPACSLSVSIHDLAPLQFLGKGKTFYVSKLFLPATVRIERCAWTTKLAMREILCSTDLPGEDEPRTVTCKRPLIQLESDGNTKDWAANERVRAVKLEVQVLTHHWLYLHKNIVDFLGIRWECDLPDFEPGTSIKPGPSMRIPALLLEYAEHGSLDGFLRTHLYKSLSLDKRASLCRDVAEGLGALHKCGIVHGDVKLDNVLIFDEYEKDCGQIVSGLRAKLTDFGFSIKRSDKSQMKTDHTPRWNLKGRTWPWNDPQWHMPRTWSQLEKTDVFSYGLLAWSALTGEIIGNLFDFGGISTDDYQELRDIVEGMKDGMLSRNAANTFRHEDDTVQLLTECLFDCSLDPEVETRGTMKNILEIWNTWYSRDPPYQPLPPATVIGPAQDVGDNRRVHFHRVVRSMSNFPLSIKQQYINALTRLDYAGHGDEGLIATLFCAFAHLIGWGVERNPDEAKRIVDSLAGLNPLVSVFQTMFLPDATMEERNFMLAHMQKCTPYEHGIFTRLLGLVATSASVEAIAQLAKVFPSPIPGAELYARTRCFGYRRWKYGFDNGDHPLHRQEEFGGELHTHELEDIRQKHPTIGLSIGHSELHFAVFSGFTGTIEIFIRSNDFDPRSLESKDYNGDTPLFSACRLGLFSIAKLLIEAGADVKTRNIYGETILHFLTEFKDSDDLIEISNLIFAHGGTELIDAYCDDRSYPLEPMTLMPHMKGVPLHTAVLRNHLSLVKILLKHGANPFETSVPENLCPAQIAASGHFVQSLQLFWEKCPWERNWTDNELLGLAVVGFAEFQTVYFHATRAKEMMQRTLGFLLDKAVSKNSIKIGDRPLLQHVVRYGSAEMVEYIISTVGTSEINTYFMGATPLHVAVNDGSYEIFKILMQNGADASLPVKAPIQTSTLTYSCLSWGDGTEITKCLLEAIPCLTDTDGISPLWAAISTCNFLAASLLLSSGVSIDSVDSSEFTTFGMVIRNCTLNVIAQLRFLLDHQVAVGKDPASFICHPATNGTALHCLAVFPMEVPLYDRSMMSNVLDYLLDKFGFPQHINARTDDGLTALHVAASCGNVQMVQRLLELDFIHMDPQDTQAGSTAYRIAQTQLFKGVPESIVQMGPRAVESYKTDRVEVINIFQKKLGKGRYFSGIEHIGSRLVEMDGTARMAHLLLAEVEVEEDDEKEG